MILCSSSIIFILRYVESKLTLLTYLMGNNTVLTVISYCTKGLNNSKTKQKPIPNIHKKTLFRQYRNAVFHDRFDQLLFITPQWHKSIKSRVFNLTAGS